MTNKPSNYDVIQDARPLNEIPKAAESVDMGSQVIINVANPETPTDAANRLYVDNIAIGLAWRPPVRLFDATHITKPTGDPVTIDTKSVLPDDRVLFVALSVAGDNNRVYKAVGTGTNITGWILELDGKAGDGSPSDGDALFVKDGVAYTDQGWTYNGGAWVQFTGLGSITVGAGLTKVLNEIKVGQGDGIYLTAGPTGAVAVNITGTTGLQFIGVSPLTALGVKVDGATIGINMSNQLYSMVTCQWTRGTGEIHPAISGERVQPATDNATDLGYEDLVTPANSMRFRSIYLSGDVKIGSKDKGFYLYGGAAGLKTVPAGHGGFRVVLDLCSTGTSQASAITDSSNPANPIVFECPVALPADYPSCYSGTPIFANDNEIITKKYVDDTIMWDRVTGTPNYILPHISGDSIYPNGTADIGAIGTRFRSMYLSNSIDFQDKFSIGWNGGNFYGLKFDTDGYMKYYSESASAARGHIFYNHATAYQALKIETSNNSGGVTTITVGGKIVPSANGVYDLGDTTPLKFNNLYLAGNIGADTHRPPTSYLNVISIKNISYPTEDYSISAVGSAGLLRISSVNHNKYIEFPATSDGFRLKTASTDCYLYLNNTATDDSCYVWRNVADLYVVAQGNLNLYRAGFNGAAAISATSTSILFNNHLVPTTNNTYDLGENSGPSKWKNLYLSGYVYLGNVASLPVATSAYRGAIIRVEGGAGVADVAYLCIKDSSDNYVWKTISLT